MDETVSTLPDTGLVRLTQLIGQKAVSDEQAKRNRESEKRNRKPRPARQGIIPLSESKVWQMVRDGSFPAPVKMEGSRCAFWNVDDVRAWLRDSKQPPKKVIKELRMDMLTKKVSVRGRLANDVVKAIGSDASGLDLLCFLNQYLLRHPNDLACYHDNEVMIVGKKSDRGKYLPDW